ncbi:MAG: hypothetical protein IT213_14670 [Cytophagales bacterium]|nr:hypothetical protein [Cytophagales bacterium]
MKVVLFFSMLFFICESSVAQIRDRDWFNVVISDIENKISMNGQQFNYLVIRAWAYHSIDSFKNALGDYEAAIKIDSSSHEVFYRKADLELDMGEYSMALRDINKAISLNSDSLDYFITRGVIFEKLNRSDQALSDYNFVLGKSVDNKLALRNRGLLLCRKKDSLKYGLKDLERLLKIDYSVENLTDLGIVQIKNDLFEKAVQSFSEVLNIESNNSRAYISRGYCYGMQQKYSLAFHDFDKALQIEPKNPLLYREKGKVYLKMNNKVKACEQFKIAKELGLLLDSGLLENCI